MTKSLPAAEDCSCTHLDHVTSTHLFLSAQYMQVAVGSAGAAMDMQRKGARQRQKAATVLNYHSSRSHSIFTVH